LARALGMTVSQLLENTTSEELAEWQALYILEKEEHEERKDVYAKKTAAEAKARKQGMF